jgi:hypothetical protein
MAEVEFGTLSTLRNKLLSAPSGKLETNPKLERLFNQILSDWAGKRNKALHGIVKISKDQAKDWETFLVQAKKAAEEGRKYFNKLNNELKKERRNN